MCLYCFCFVCFGVCCFVRFLFVSLLFCFARRQILRSGFGNPQKSLVRDRPKKIPQHPRTNPRRKSLDIHGNSMKQSWNISEPGRRSREIKEKPRENKKGTTRKTQNRLDHPWKRALFLIFCYSKTRVYIFFIYRMLIENIGAEATYAALVQWHHWPSLSCLWPQGLCATLSLAPRSWLPLCRFGTSELE